MEKYYHFSGIELAVSLPEERMYRDDLQLAPFRTDRVNDPHRCEVRVEPDLELPAEQELATLPGSRVYAWGEDGYVRYLGAVEADVAQAYCRAAHRGKHHAITLTASHVTGAVSARLVLNGLDVEHLVSQAGGVILHASYIDWEGKAILFTAPSGTGKSTQAELWKTYRNAEIINGDRAVILPREGQLFAGGLPFSGSSPYCKDRTLPLGAVVYLKQAPKTAIRSLKGLEAFRRIWEGVCVNSWNRQDVDTAVGLVEALLGQVSVLELACTPDETAVKALEAQLRKQE